MLNLKHSIICSQINIPDQFKRVELVGVDLIIRNTSTRIIVCYHPCHNDDMSLLIEALKYLLSSHTNVFLCGDFNMPHVNWESLSASDKKCNEFLTFVLNSGLTQYVHEPTRLHPDHILDLVLTNTPIIHDVVVGELFSDHRLIKTTLTLQFETPNENKSLLNYWKGDYTMINYIIANINWNNLLADIPVERMYNVFLDILKKLIALYIPKSNPKKHTKKYPPYIKRLQHDKLYIWRLEGNSTLYKNLCASLKTALRDLEKDKLERNLVSGSSKKCFTYIKNQMGTKNEIGILKNGNNACLTDTQKSSFLAESFSNVFTQDDGINPHIPAKTKSITDNVVIEPFMVEALLLKLKDRINTTPDELPALFLKKVATSIALPLSLIFNESLKTGAIPSLWKEAIILPLFKKGSRSDASNYRPISLTSSVCKTMEKLVRNAIVGHLKSAKLLVNNQYGFRDKKSCESQLIRYSGDLLFDSSSKKPIWAVYVDFKKAFDTVSHSKLVSKLGSCGIAGNLLNWLESFLTGRSQKVMVNKTMSKPMAVSSGVPQGSVLGPLLFLIFINDIGDKYISNYLLYADDLKLYGTDETTLQSDLFKLESWCKTWQMSVAPNKCEVIKFSLSKRKSSYTHVSSKFTLNGLSLPTTSTIRDLGVYFSQDLTFSRHIEITIRKCHMRINILFRILTHSSFEVILKCFLIYVRPIIEYGTVVFSPITKVMIRKLESLQKSFLYRCYKKFNMSYISYFDCLETWKLESLEYRRLINDLLCIYKSLISKEICTYDNLRMYFPDVANLRRHKYYIRCALKNTSNQRSQFIGNRALNCWNELPEHVFPVKISSRCFKSNIAKLNLTKYLTLNTHTI
ncbi:hypothetical protein CRE_04257 [Caenorhabditis remanei]|uniref:Reverse transcriptase domain-containing protein n=1 Tax=Caenorhabditis remanei TaxID=31234 RepID=E3N681_CAERE|nr:hypothetical protein CRE_04257 [Caenorhabditis remanei]